jgi:hypothetical protein
MITVFDIPTTSGRRYNFWRIVQLICSDVSVAQRFGIGQTDVQAQASEQTLRATREIFKITPIGLKALSEKRVFNALSLIYTMLSPAGLATAISIPYYCTVNIIKRAWINAVPNISSVGKCTICDQDEKVRGLKPH